MINFYTVFLSIFFLGQFFCKIFLDTRELKHLISGHMYYLRFLQSWPNPLLSPRPFGPSDSQRLLRGLTTPSGGPAHIGLALRRQLQLDRARVQLLGAKQVLQSPHLGAVECQQDLLVLGITVIWKQNTHFPPLCRRPSGPRRSPLSPEAFHGVEEETLRGQGLEHEEGGGVGLAQEVVHVQDVFLAALGQWGNEGIVTQHRRAWLRLWFDTWGGRGSKRLGITKRLAKQVVRVPAVLAHFEVVVVDDGVVFRYAVGLWVELMMKITLNTCWHIRGGWRGAHVVLRDVHTGSDAGLELGAGAHHGLGPTNVQHGRRAVLLPAADALKYRKVISTMFIRFTQALIVALYWHSYRFSLSLLTKCLIKW